MMRISVISALAAACFASSLPGSDDGVLAPADSKSQELKELLALDSFNVTSSDAEQNRMHAVCDMEYRLSKTAGMGKQGLGISNLLVTPAAPAVFNPFTMPLAAVKAHIALLKQQEEWLQAQSNAFDGTSSKATGATTAAAKTSKVKIASCGHIAAGATAIAMVTASASKAATDAFVIELVTEATAAAGQILQITIDGGSSAITSSPGAQTVTVPTIATTGSGALGGGTRPCYQTAGTDGVCKKADGTAMSDAGIVKAATKKPTGEASQAQHTLELAGTGAKDVKVGNAGIIIQYTLAEGLEKLPAGSYWVIGASANFVAGADRPKETITAEFIEGSASSGALDGKDSCTMTV